MLLAASFSYVLLAWTAAAREMTPAGAQTITTSGHTQDDSFHLNGGDGSATWTVHYEVSKTSTSTLSGQEGPFASQAEADAAAEAAKNAAIGQLQNEAQGMVDAAIAAARAQLANIAFSYDEITIPHGFDSTPGALGSHQTITVPANSSNDYPMKNDEWSVKVSIDKIDSETKQRIKGDAEFKIFEWDVVRKCYIPNTRPVMVLVGAMLIFGERLNLYQWIGVMLAILSFFMLSRSGKKEGIDFKHNKWIYFIVLAAITGAISGLYDKYLMKQFNPMVVQSWYNVYQVFIMCPIILLLWYPKRKESTPFRWDWTIILISVFLSAADFAYFYALSYEDSMISIVSMVRRGSVVVSFLFGALFFREKNLKSKAVDLILVLIGMFFLYLGSK